MMTFFAIIYLILMCCVVYILHKEYDEITELIDSRKKRIIANVAIILIAPILIIIEIIKLLKKELTK